MNLHNLPNVIGAQRQLLKAIDDANISDEDMLKLTELDPEFKKYASVIAYVYNKIDPADIKPWSEINKDSTHDEADTEPKQEWIPATKLRNMYPLAYSFLRNRVDLSANGKETIWNAFKKDYPEYSISDDEFYRLMRLVINIRTEKAREIDDKLNSSLTTTKKSEDSTVGKVDKHVIDEHVDESKKDEKSEVKTEKDIKEMYPLQYSWLRDQQIGYLKKNTVTSIRNDFEKKHPRQKDKCGRTTFGRLIKLALEGKTNEHNETKASTPEPIGQFKEYPKNPNVRFFENGCVQCLTKEGNWTTRKITINGGYAVISFQGKTISIAKGMLETFKPAKFADGKIHVPYYKDGNKLNCHIDNLSWDLPNTKPSAKELHEACEVIAKNPSASVQEWLAIMAKNGKGVQNHALDSILKGEYTSISEKYFTLQNGKPIVKETKPPVTASETSQLKPGVTDGINIKRDTSPATDKLVNTINYKKLMEDRRGDVLGYFKATKNLKMAVKAFEAKMELNMNIDASDKIIPVLEFSLDKDGNIRNTGEVLKDITKKYGNLYITQNYVKDVQNGKLGKEYSDLVFNK